jgi:hypothetical protein
MAQKRSACSAVWCRANQDVTKYRLLEFQQLCQLARCYIVIAEHSVAECLMLEHAASDKFMPFLDG